MRPPPGSAAWPLPARLPAARPHAGRLRPVPPALFPRRARVAVAPRALAPPARTKRDSLGGRHPPTGSDGDAGADAGPTRRPSAAPDASNSSLRGWCAPIPLLPHVLTPGAAAPPGPDLATRAAAASGGSAPRARLRRRHPRPFVGWSWRPTLGHG